MPKYERYQDYVIREGKLLGEFEEMYQDFDDPWNQSAEHEALEKDIAIRLLSEAPGIKTVVELGCGFGDFTARIADAGLNAIGIDISETAIAKAKKRHPAAAFRAGTITDFSLLKSLAPDVIVMAEITWYILDSLRPFLSFLKADMPNTSLLHLLTTYPEGTQKYGRDHFTSLDEMRSFFGMRYRSYGVIPHNGTFRTWFWGDWH